MAVDTAGTKPSWFGSLAGRLARKASRKSGAARKGRAPKRATASAAHDAVSSCSAHAPAKDSFAKVHASPPGGCHATTPASSKDAIPGTAMPANACNTSNSCAGMGKISKYKTILTTDPNPPVPGQKFQLTFHIKDPQGQPVTHFEREMAKYMHLLLVSEDLKDFQHIHPKLNPDGSLTISTVLKHGCPYNVSTQFVPDDGAGGQHTQLTLNPVNVQHSKPDLAPELAANKQQKFVLEAGGAHLKFRTPGNRLPVMKAGRAEKLLVDFTEAKTGKPLRDLRLWLTAPIHVMAFDQKGNMVQHVHGFVDEGWINGKFVREGDATQVVVPQIVFKKPGLYKVFTQFKRDERIVTLPWVIEVKP
jgi:hypothetical protein